jgi:hypothetical protein
MQATFKPQAKSNAKRFLINTCKVVESNIEAYLTQVDGQWGTWVGEDGKAVPLALANVVDTKEESHEESVEAPNPFLQLLGAHVVPATGTPSAVVVDGKRVQPEDVKEQKEPAKSKPVQVGDPCPLCGADHSSQTWANENVSLFCHGCSRTYSVNTGREIRTGYSRETSTRGYKIDKGRETRNGITRPSAETTCGKVWAFFDKHPEKVGTPIRPIAEANGWSKITVSCQLRVWRKFNGLSAK